MATQSPVTGKSVAFVLLNNHFPAILPFISPDAVMIWYKSTDCDRIRPGIQPGWVTRENLLCHSLFHPYCSKFKISSKIGCKMDQTFKGRHTRRLTELARLNQRQRVRQPSRYVHSTDSFTSFIIHTPPCYRINISLL
jgi:hypothetical protein